MAVAITVTDGVTGGPAWIMFICVPLAGVSYLGGVSLYSAALPDIDGTAERIVEPWHEAPNLAAVHPTSATLARPVPAPDESAALISNAGLISAAPQPVPATADEADPLIAHVREEIRALLDVQARQSLRWAWFFFLLGIPVGIAIQLLF